MNIISAKITKKTDLSVQSRPLAADMSLNNSIENDSVLTSSTFDSNSGDFSVENEFDSDENARNFVLKNRKTEKNLQKLKDNKVEIEENQENTKIDEINLPMKGWKIVFTGRLEKFTRGEAEEICNSLGGDVTDSINKKVKILVCAGEESGYVRQDLFR